MTADVVLRSLGVLLDESSGDVPDFIMAKCGNPPPPVSMIQSMDDRECLATSAGCGQPLQQPIVAKPHSISIVAFGKIEAMTK